MGEGLKNRAAPYNWKSPLIECHFDEFFSFGNSYDWNRLPGVRREEWFVEFYVAIFRRWEVPFYRATYRLFLDACIVVETYRRAFDTLETLETSAELDKNIVGKRKL